MLMRGFGAGGGRAGSRGTSCVLLLCYVLLFSKYIYIYIYIYLFSLGARLCIVDYGEKIYDGNRLLLVVLLLLVLLSPLLLTVLLLLLLLILYISIYYVSII